MSSDQPRDGAQKGGDGAVDEQRDGGGVIVIPDAVVLQRVEDETVLLDTSSGMYFGLDGIGSHMLEVMLRKSDVDDVVRALLEHYDTTETVLRRDVARLVDELEEHRLAVRRAGRWTDAAEASSDVADDLGDG